MNSSVASACGDGVSGPPRSPTRRERRQMALLYLSGSSDSASASLSSPGGVPHLVPSVSVDSSIDSSFSSCTSSSSSSPDRVSVHTKSPSSSSSSSSPGESCCSGAVSRSAAELAELKRRRRGGRPRAIIPGRSASALSSSTIGGGSPSSSPAAAASSPPPSPARGRDTSTVRPVPITPPRRPGEESEPGDGNGNAETPGIPSTKSRAKFESAFLKRRGVVVTSHMSKTDLVQMVRRKAAAGVTTKSSTSAGEGDGERVGSFDNAADDDDDDDDDGSVASDGAMCGTGRYHDEDGGRTLPPSAAAVRAKVAAREKDGESRLQRVARRTLAHASTTATAPSSSTTRVRRSIVAP